MAKSQNAFNKKQKEKTRLQKKQDKQARKEQRKANSSGGALEDMIAYVDEYGNIVDTPPEIDPKKKPIDASEIEIGVPSRVDEPEPERRGRVTFFDHNKGFGFIEQDGSRDRFFVHVNNIKQPIQEGDRVSFIAQKGMKGMDAVEVALINSAS